jgi:quinol-cytochrome oxidoreductase complex cytochrome b subunit
MLSGWVAKSLDPPATINNIYHIVGTWVQPASKPDGGTAASYVRENKKKMKVEKKKAKLAAAMVLFLFLFLYFYYVKSN